MAKDTASSTTSEIVTFLRKHDYVMVRELGQGACGLTVLLHDNVIDEFYVCKKYSPFSESRRQELFENFKREIKLLHRIHHTNVVRVFNHYLYPAQFTGYILMEFVDGSHIDEYLKANQDKVNALFLQAVDGFTYLESSGILHRDIRPANLMVDNDGTLKIIDMGFGKKIAGSKDFDKSISLNWWCQPPEDFDAARYDFTTEVYFVGKLFEKLILDNGIAHFQYSDLVGRMCDRNPATRISHFSHISQTVGNNRFSEISFRASDRVVYRDFADALCLQLTKIENGAKYIEDIPRVERNLRDAYQRFMLEEAVPDCSIVTCCFIDGAYYFRRGGLRVNVVKKFLELLGTCTAERGRVLLANLHSRLDSLPRYAEPPPDDDDIPF